MFFNDTDDPFPDLAGSHAEIWRRIRALISPTFSPKIVNQMSPYIQAGIDKLIARLDEREKEGIAFDIDRYLQTDIKTYTWLTCTYH